MFNQYTLTDEALFPAAAKVAVLQDWQRFIHSGFKKIFFTEALWRTLHTSCGFMAHYGRERFWRYYFDEAEIGRLRALVDQFGGDRRAAEGGDHSWLGGPAADLKESMCQEMVLVYEPITTLLDDLVRQHNQLIAAWHEFARQADLPEMVLPAGYAVGENTRNLLAYAIQIALHKKRALAGLQLRFPAPLLYATEAESSDPMTSG